MTGKQFLEQGAVLRAAQINLENQILRKEVHRSSPRSSAPDGLKQRYAAATEALNEHIAKFLRGD